MWLKKAIPIALLAIFGNLRVSRALAEPIPTIEYTAGARRLKAPDWERVNWSNLGSISDAGCFQIPGNWVASIGYDPSRCWRVGQNPSQFLMLGDFLKVDGSSEFGLEGFALRQISQLTNTNLERLSLNDFHLTRWQNIDSLVEAIPGLESFNVGEIKPIYDLVKQSELFSYSVSEIEHLSIGQLLSQFPDLGELSLSNLNLNRYSLNSIPGMTLVPIASFHKWQQSLISQVPGLSLVPFAKFPITVPMDLNNYALVDWVWGKAEHGDERLDDSAFVSGRVSWGTNIPQRCPPRKPCAYLELTDILGVSGPNYGKRWASGITHKVKGGEGVLGRVNNGLEPTGRLVFGHIFKVALLQTIESQGLGKFGTFYRICVRYPQDLGCTPYHIGPGPWFDAREQDLVLLGANSPRSNPPTVYLPDSDRHQKPPNHPTSNRPVPPPPGNINQAILQAANAMRGFPTDNRYSPLATKNGKLACAWAVNKVLSHAGLQTLANNSLRVLEVEADLRNGRGVQVSPQQAQPGDLVLVDAGSHTNSQHIGICLTPGCTQTISNSSSKASFSWIGNGRFSPFYPGARRAIYRVVK